MRIADAMSLCAVLAGFAVGLPAGAAEPTPETINVVSCVDNRDGTVTADWMNKIWKFDVTKQINKYRSKKIGIDIFVDVNKENNSILKYKFISNCNINKKYILTSGGRLPPGPAINQAPIEGSIEDLIPVSIIWYVFS